MATTVGQDHCVEIWDVQLKRRLAKLDSEEVGCIAISLDGNSLFTSNSYGKIQVWDTTNFQLRYEMTQGSCCTVIKITPDGNFLLTGDISGKVQVWDLKKRKLAKTIANLSYPISSLAISDQGDRLAFSACSELYTIASDRKPAGQVQIRSLPEGKLITRLDSR